MKILPVRLTGAHRHKKALSTILHIYLGLPEVTEWRDFVVTTSPAFTVAKLSCWS